MGNGSQSNSSQPNKLIVVTDACCVVPDAHKSGRASKGKCACGVIFLANEKKIENIIDERGKYLGEMTAPEAEYRGLEFAIDIASEYSMQHLEVWLDSEFIVRQFSGKYRIKASHLKSIHDKIRGMEARYKSVDYFHHSRENVVAKKADEVAHLHYQKNA